MSDIGKAFRNWQEQDINKLKNIKERYRREDTILFKYFIIELVGFIILLGLIFNVI